MELKDVKVGQRVRIVNRTKVYPLTFNLESIGESGVVSVVADLDYQGLLTVRVKLDHTGNYDWGNHKDLELIDPIGINVWVRPKAENNIVNEAVRVLACTFNFISKFFKRK